MGMAHAWGLANVWFRNAQHGDPFGQQEIERGGVGAARPINAQIGIYWMLLYDCLVIYSSCHVMICFIQGL
jgi:hypothetical protein